MIVQIRRDNGQITPIHLECFEYYLNEECEIRVKDTDTIGTEATVYFKDREEKQKVMSWVKEQLGETERCQSLWDWLKPISQREENIVDWFMND